MDITLERILSLIPKKPDGKFVHGAKKEFCDRIGAPSNIVNEWERGTNRSYRNYLYQIASEYGVSVEWLKGESDTKEKSAVSEDTTLHETGYDLLSDANRAIIDDLIVKLLKSQSDD